MGVKTVKLLLSKVPLSKIKLTAIVFKKKKGAKK